MKKISEFQKENNLQADGIIGRRTIEKMMAVWGIPSKAQIANFLGQLHHESGGFSRTLENLNYSIDRMLEIFKSDFDTNKDRVLSVQEKKRALSLAGNPMKIANFVYANQNGNGNEASGDGWRFRGAGAIQLTGRENYIRFEAWLRLTGLWRSGDLVLTAEIVADCYFWETGLFFFTVNNLWNQAKFIDDESVKAITKKINGGVNGLADRRDKVKYYYNLIK